MFGTVTGRVLVALPANDYDFVDAESGRHLVGISRKVWVFQPGATKPLLMKFDDNKVGAHDAFMQAEFGDEFTATCEGVNSGSRDFESAKFGEFVGVPKFASKGVRAAS